MSADESAQSKHSASTGDFPPRMQKSRQWPQAGNVLWGNLQKMNRRADRVTLSADEVGGEGGGEVES